jgi:putative ABC transport system permease protein
MFRDFSTRLRHLLSRKTHREVDEELEFHLERQVEANVAAGMTPEEARRQAGIAFGGVERAREQCRESRPGYFMETLLQDVRYALRGFRRNPVFTVTVVATLMLGIGATTAVFSVVDRILFRALPYAHADRLVSVGLVQMLEPQEFMVGGFYYDWKENQRPFEALAGENAVAQACDVAVNSPVRLSCTRAEAEFLPMLGVSPVLGRNFLPEEDRPGGPKVALISYGVWRTQYNLDPGVLNRLIEVDGDPVRVIGVLPKDFEMPSMHQADVLMPLARDGAAQRKMSPGAPVRAFARLKPGVSVVQAREELEPLYQQALTIIPADIRKDFHLRVRSLRDRQIQDVRLIAWVLLGVVLTVLLIACANVASLLLARGAARQRELAVRSALGASRVRLARQALTEAILLSVTGAAAGCALAEGLLKLFVALAPAGVPFLSKAQLDWRIVGFTLILAVICGLIFGLAPALERSSALMLTGRLPAGVSHAGVRQWMVVGQIAASIVLLAGAMLLMRSFWNLEHQRLGMRSDNTLTVSITVGRHNYPTGEKEMAFFQRLQQRLQFGPGVSMVAMSDSLPPGANHNGQRYDQIVVAGRPPTPGATGSMATFRWVSPDYFRALDIPVVRGEGFSDAEVDESDRVTVLSQTLAERLFPGENPVGQRLQFEGWDPTAPWWTVVGVAADVKNGGLSGDQLPEYYKLRRNRAEDWGGSGEWGRTAVMVVKTSLPAKAMTPWIRSQVATLDSTLPVDIETLQGRVNKLADQPRFQTTLVGFFAAIGLVLAVIGLYGVIAFLVAQRTQEIGVRMALGAGRGDTLRLVLGKSVRLIVCGTVVGLVAALAVSRVLRSLLFGVGPHDPVTFVLVTLLLAFVAVLATLIPARAASRVDPMEALRCE